MWRTANCTVLITAECAFVCVFVCLYVVVFVFMDLCIFPCISAVSMLFCLHDIWVCLDLLRVSCVSTCVCTGFTCFINTGRNQHLWEQSQGEAAAVNTNQVAGNPNLTFRLQEDQLPLSTAADLLSLLLWPTQYGEQRRQTLMLRNLAGNTKTVVTP